MIYTYVVDDELAVLARLAALFTPYAEPSEVQVALSRDPVWQLLRPELQIAANRLLRLELEEDDRGSSSVKLNEFPPSDPPAARLARPADEEVKLWTAVVNTKAVPGSMEAVARDLLLSTGADATPANAEKIIELYRGIAAGPQDSFHVAMAILRANTIARSRKMGLESDVRADLLILAERALATPMAPGISTRLAGGIAEGPRFGSRTADELTRLAAILDKIEDDHGDPSTADWIADIRLTAAETDAERETARRHHVEQYIAEADSDSVALRAMIWAEKAAELATKYELHDLHDAAVLKMQHLSRQDLGWHHHVEERLVPNGVFRQRERRVAKLSSWEQALSLFLAEGSPSGNASANELAAQGLRRTLLDLVGGRSFGVHQLPQRTHGPAEEERLQKVIESNIAGSAIVLRVDLTAIASRFGVPAEDEIIAFVSTAYGSSPELVKSFAQALRLYWLGDWSGAARLAIPLTEAGARELLFLMDEPMYRTERGASAGRFPALDFYLDKLESKGLDPDWVTALRGTLLSTGMNHRNLLAHAFQLHFSAPQAALAIRLAGLFIAMPVGTGAIEDERARHPLALPRRKLRRRIGWVWR